MKTIKDLKTIKEQTYRKVVSGVNTIEDIPRIIEGYKNHIADIPGATMKVKDGKIEFNNGQFAMLPKMKCETVGVLTIRAGGDYTFTDKETGKPSYGCKLTTKNVEFIEGGFAVKYDNGMTITFVAE